MTVHGQGGRNPSKKRQRDQDQRLAGPRAGGHMDSVAQGNRQSVCMCMKVSERGGKRGQLAGSGGGRNRAIDSKGLNRGESGRSRGEVAMCEV